MINLDKIKNSFNLILLNAISQDTFISDIVFEKQEYLAFILYSEKICPNSKVALIDHRGKKEFFISIENIDFKLRRTFECEIKEKETHFTLKEGDGFIKTKSIRVFSNENKILV